MNAEVIENFSFTAPRISPEDLARERLDLTEEERRVVDGDKYGGKGQKATEETEEYINDALDSLEKALHSIKVKPEYDEALKRCPESTQSREFRLKMLRAEMFVAKKTAERIVKYWETKVMVWGEDIAYRDGRDPTLADMSQEDYNSLLLSKWMILPRKDRHGRGIMYVCRPAWAYQERKNLLRAVWYMWNAAVEDEAIQKRGLVFLSYAVGDSALRYDRKVDTHVVRVFRACPVRVCCGHHVADSWVIKMMFPFALFMMGRSIRNRVELHCDPEHLIEDLEKYGITEAEVPREAGGTLDFDFEEWLSDRRARGL